MQRPSATRFLSGRSAIARVGLAFIVASGMGVGMLASASPAAAYTSILPITVSSGATMCAELAYNAGFRGNDLVRIVEIGMAESGCRNVNNGNAIGVWQELTGYWQGVVCSDLSQTWCNAATAYYIVYHGGGWTKWSTYTSGAYTKYLANAQGATLSSASKTTAFYASPGTITISMKATLTVGSGGSGAIVSASATVMWNPTQYSNTSGIKPGSAVPVSNYVSYSQALPAGAFTGNDYNYYEPWVIASRSQFPFIGWSCGSDGAAFAGGCS
jgi:Lysozyme like domain